MKTPLVLQIKKNTYFEYVFLAEFYHDSKILTIDQAKLARKVSQHCAYIRGYPQIRGACRCVLYAEEKNLL